MPMAKALSSTRKQAGVASDSPLQAFLRWWGRELAWFIPEALRERGLPASRLLWLEVSKGEAVFSRIGRTRSTEVGRIDLAAHDSAAEQLSFDKLFARIGRQPVGIGVQSDHVLRKALFLPLATRDNLEQVVRFEMDRQTPYRVENVYFHLRERGVVADQVQVDLTVMPRDVAMPALERAKEWGLEVHGIAIQHELDGRRGYTNLLPKALRPRTGRIWPWFYGVMAALTIALIAALVVIPIWQKREVAIAMMPLVTQAEREAKAVAALKEQFEAALARHNYLLEKRLTTTSSVAILEEVTRLLPDNTWAQSLEVRGSEVLIQGETGSSSRLVGLFGHSNLFGEANHRAPLVKTQNDMERFHLAVALRPVTVEAVLKEIRTQRATSVGKSEPLPANGPRSRGKT